MINDLKPGVTGEVKKRTYNGTLGDANIAMTDHVPKFFQSLICVNSFHAKQFFLKA